MRFVAHVLLWQSSLKERKEHVVVSTMKQGSHTGWDVKLFSHVGKKMWVFYILTRASTPILSGKLQTIYEET